MIVPFIEGECTINLQGREFTSGGSWLARCSDGVMRGCVYVKDTPVVLDGTGGYKPAPFISWRDWGSRIRYGSGDVITWHGEVIAPCSWTNYINGLGIRMRRVSFTLTLSGGRPYKFIGDYCPDWSEFVRVRSTRKVV